MLIIGSHALIAHGVRVGRKPSDLDVIATQEEADALVSRLSEVTYGNIRTEEKKNKIIVHVKEHRPVEIEIADALANPCGLELMDHRAIYGQKRVKGNDLYQGAFEGAYYAHPEDVLALKLSHRYLKNNPHFRKTMDDILALRGLKYRVPEELNEWLKRREKWTYDYGHPSLKRDKGQFFSGDGINYVYEHDDIHAALATLIPPDLEIWGARPQRPAYIQFQKDPTLDVSVSKEKWLKCSEEVKLYSVLEESYVLALERSQIPNDFAIAPRTSFLIALEKVCTSITSGWWREYAWEHYYQVLGMYNDDYVDRFQDALAEGRISNYKSAAE